MRNPGPDAAWPGRRAQSECSHDCWPTDSWRWHRTEASDWTAAVDVAAEDSDADAVAAAWRYGWGLTQHTLTVSGRLGGETV